MILSKKIPPLVIANNRKRRGRNITIPPSTPLDPSVEDYFNRVESVSSFNNGVHTAQYTKDAIATFVASMKACGAWDECLEIYLFNGPANLTGALQKLKYANDPTLGVVGITNGNYYAAGSLPGIEPGFNNNTKALRTGISSYWLTSGVSHIAGYLIRKVAAPSWQGFAGVGQFYLLNEASATAYGLWFKDSRFSAQTIVTSGSPGQNNSFIIAQGDGSANRMYRNGSSIANDPSGHDGSRTTNREMFLFATNSGSDTPYFAAANRMSFISMGTTISDPVGYSNAIITLKNALS